jgi:predicted DNA-binding transcriptional regulator YafY
VIDGSSTSPTARALLALEIVQARPGITADELAGRLDVTDRAARRYVAILRESGIPIESTRGRYGGYRVGRGLRLAPMMFSASEALGLVMAVLDGHHPADDPDDPVGAAVGKLLAALPERVGAHAAAVRRHAHAVPDRRAARPDLDVTAALIAAIAARRSTRLDYTTGAGSRRPIDVDPWAAVIRHGRWYLLCATSTTGETRALRIDRVGAVAELGPAPAPPPDLDPIDMLERHLASGWPYDVRVEFEALAAEVAPWISASMGEIRPKPDGSGAVLVGSTNNPQMYAGEWLAAIPFPFRVAGGPELRDAVSAVGRRMLDAAHAPAR